MKYLFTLPVWLFISACASTPPVKAIDQGRPVQVQQEVKFDKDQTFKAAQASYRAEEFQKAWDSFNQILLRYPEDKPARIGLGNSALALGQAEEAFAIFSALSDEYAVTKENKDVQVGFILSSVLTGRSERPAIDINHAMSLNTADGRLWNVMGRLLDAQGEWVSAQVNYVNAMKYGGVRSSAINNLGSSLLMQKRLPEALKKFEQARSIQPDNLTYDMNRRLALFLMEKEDKATESLDDEHHAKLLYKVAELSLTYGELDEAQDLFVRAIKKHPRYFKQAYAQLENISAK